jgi:hypothetical protein
MTPRESTPRLLRQLSRTGEYVFREEVKLDDSSFDSLWYAWDAAQEEAELAYETWGDDPGRESYAVYRAAQDRADAAQDALARQAIEGP